MGKIGLGKSDLGSFRIRVMGELCPQCCWHGLAGIDNVEGCVSLETLHLSLREVIPPLIEKHGSHSRRCV